MRESFFQLAVQAKNNKLLRQNLVFFIGSIGVAGLNYLFYPTVGRILHPKDFGEVQVVLALSMQALAVFSIVRLIVVREVANADAEGSAVIANRVRQFMRQISVIVAIIGLLISPFLARSLQYSSIVPLLLLVLLVVLAIVRLPVDGYLRGRQLFTQSAISDLSNAGLKLLFGIVAGLAGFGVVGVLSGVILASALSYAFELYSARKAGLNAVASKDKERLSLPVLKFALKSLASVGLASMSITILVGLDTVMAKRFFSPDVAGLYSGISIISNILFYATISVTGVLFSSVKRRQAATANRRILAISITLLLAVGVVGMVVFAVWPEFVISLLLGERYLPLAHILPYAGGAMLALSFTNLIMMYSIALDTKGVGIVSGIGTAIVIVTILISHKTIESLAVSFCIGNLLMLIICLVWIVFKHKQSKANQ